MPRDAGPVHPAIVELIGCGFPAMMCGLCGGYTVLDARPRANQPMKQLSHQYHVFTATACRAAGHVVHHAITAVAVFNRTSQNNTPPPPPPTSPQYVLLDRRLRRRHRARPRATRTSRRTSIDFRARGPHLPEPRCRPPARCRPRPCRPPTRCRPRRPCRPGPPCSRERGRVPRAVPVPAVGVRENRGVTRAPRPAVPAVVPVLTTDVSWASPPLRWHDDPGSRTARAAAASRAVSIIPPGGSPSHPSGGMQPQNTPPEGSGEYHNDGSEHSAVDLPHVHPAANTAAHHHPKASFIRVPRD